MIRCGRSGIKPLVSVTGNEPHTHTERIHQKVEKCRPIEPSNTVRRGKKREKMYKTQRPPKSQYMAALFFTHIENTKKNISFLKRSGRR
jgi:hypothetical protein